MEKVEVIVKKGSGKKFPTDKINDGDKIKVTVETARKLVKNGYVDYPTEGKSASK